MKRLDGDIFPMRDGSNSCYKEDTIQCSDGFSRTANIHKETDPEDPQGLLHQFNDDLGCIGLLTAYNVLGKSRCRKSPGVINITRFRKEVKSQPCDLFYNFTIAKFSS